MNDNLRENAERGVFSGKLGYVLATAGSAVGLGNIWRFPYLAARYGGGIFLLVYLLLALTFGYTLMMTESTMGRLTGKSPVGAFKSFSKRGIAKAGGWINAVIPMLILPYYSVIGGWVCKYLFEYITGNVSGTAQDDYFTGFITSAGDAELWFIVFAALTLLVIICGVENGVEKVSKFMMPVLVCLAVIVAVYSMTRPGAGAGIKYFLVPDFKHFSWMTVVAALGQMFYSLSIAMGILITYGSYMKKDVDIEKATHQVIFFDSGIAILAGLMIMPSQAEIRTCSTKSPDSCSLPFPRSSRAWDLADPSVSCSSYWCSLLLLPALFPWQRPALPPSRMSLDGEERNQQVSLPSLC